jgi:hypothetical protein
MSTLQPGRHCLVGTAICPGPTNHHKSCIVKGSNLLHVSEMHSYIMVGHVRLSGPSWVGFQDVQEGPCLPGKLYTGVSCCSNISETEVYRIDDDQAIALSKAPSNSSMLTGIAVRLPSWP